MSDRASIKTALVTSMNTQMNVTNVGTLYYNDMDENVRGDVLFLDNIQVFPAITVGLGPERVEYHPSGFRWIYLTLYLRGYVKSEDESEEQLEHVLADIKTYIDNFEKLDYTVINPDGSTTNKSVAQMTNIGVSTDEGLMKPLGLGEVVIEVKYADRNRK